MNTSANLKSTIVTLCWWIFGINIAVTVVSLVGFIVLPVMIIAGLLLILLTAAGISLLSVFMLLLDLLATLYGMVKDLVTSAIYGILYFTGDETN
mmetsp:Transcript_31184/g.47744  ORF Transcript_31184/g.47744 Transcript_31184/m.47744 type:complete len:95 (+) Transcript_31184:540-824(+)